jgi:K+-sensing histidine kinase KdpD
MKKIHIYITTPLIVNILLSLLSVSVTTLILFFIGRDTLGEAVIALLYLVPVAWSANRWGKWPGVLAALAAALAFDFLFIPPFYTFAVARLEGWLVLGIFLGVAIVVIGRIQDSLTKAHEAVFLYELTSSLLGQHTPEAVAHIAASQLQQLFQAALVKVLFQPGKNTPSVLASEPTNRTGIGRPDCILPLLNPRGLVGEIQIWGTVHLELPPADSRFMQAFASQIAQALNRTLLPDHENLSNALTSPSSSPKR